MSASTTPMPFFVQQPAPSLRVASAEAPVSTLSADAQARRLAAAVARGDEAAFVELYDLYQNRLFRFALALGRGDEELAHEAVQSVFITAASKLRSVESEEHLWNWLARVARQQLAKVWRQRNRDSAIMVEMPECAQACVTDSGLEEQLDQALLALREEERQVVEWFYFDQLSQKQMAERLNTSPKAVASRLERARLKLRSLLKQGLST